MLLSKIEVVKIARLFQSGLLVLNSWMLWTSGTASALHLPHERLLSRLAICDSRCQWYQSTSTRITHTATGNNGIKWTTPQIETSKINYQPQWNEEMLGCALHYVWPPCATQGPRCRWQSSRQLSIVLLHWLSSLLEKLDQKVIPGDCIKNCTEFRNFKS